MSREHNFLPLIKKIDREEGSERVRMKVEMESKR